MRLGDLIRTISTIVQTGSTTVAKIILQFYGGITLNSRLATPVTVLTYGPLIAIDLSLGNNFTFTITDAVAFVLSNPTNGPTVHGMEFTVTYKNTSGGAHGAGTFGTLYKLSNANFAAVATAKNRTITFWWDGTNAIEVVRTAADVDN